jgi:hypothetical protein
MTAQQKAARLKFKAALAEAKKLRKKNCKLTQAQAVKQAFAIINEKERRNPIKKIKKTVTDSLAKFKKGFEKGYYGEDYGKKRRRRKVGAAPTKVKAKKSKRTREMHTDTKSHNVNIRVMSGVDKNLLTHLVKDLQHLTNSLAIAQYHLKKSIEAKKSSKDSDAKKYFTRMANQFRDEVKGLKAQIVIQKRLIK